MPSVLDQVIHVGLYAKTNRKPLLDFKQRRGCNKASVLRNYSDYNVESVLRRRRNICEETNQVASSVISIGENGGPHDSGGSRNGSS